MSSKGAKRSRRVPGGAAEPDVKGGGGAAAGEASSSLAAAGATTALVRSRRRSSTTAAAAESTGGAGGALAVGITAAEMSRFVEEQLRAVQRDHAREQAALRADYTRELTAVRRDHSCELTAVRSELSDLRYDNSRLCALLESSIAATEVGMVCRRHGSGPDAFREYRSVMSILFNVHAYDLSEGFMRFFTTKEACELRLVHSEFMDAIAATPWHDMRTVIQGPLADWRACFPNAHAASVRNRTDLLDADVVHFRGLRVVDMTGCTSVSDTAFVNLRGIERLVMFGCDQPGITSIAFLHLKGIRELDVGSCDVSIASSAFAFLHGARSFIPPNSANKLCVAIKDFDVMECRRLLATRALGSSCWAYAGVSFIDLPAPASVHDVLATAFVELFRFSLHEEESLGMVSDALNYFCDICFNDLGQAAFIAVGGIPVLLSAFRKHWDDLYVCYAACLALSFITRSAAGREACLAGGFVEAIMTALQIQNNDVDVVKDAIACLANVSGNSSATVASLVTSKAIPVIIAAFEMCKLHSIVCPPFSRALCNIVSFPCGVEACLAAGAVPLLAAAYARNLDAQEDAKNALQQLGYDENGFLRAP